MVVGHIIKHDIGLICHGNGPRLALVLLLLAVPVGFGSVDAVADEAEAGAVAELQRALHGPQEAGGGGVFGAGRQGHGVHRESTVSADRRPHLKRRNRTIKHH